MWKRRANRQQHFLISATSTNSVHCLCGEWLCDSLHLPLAIDYHGIEESRIIGSQLVISFEHVVGNEEGQIRRATDVNRSRSLVTAWSWPNVVRHVIHLQHSLRQP